MARDSSSGRLHSSPWWGELKRLLHLRPAAPDPDAESDGLAALFVRKREVRSDEIGTCSLHSLQHASHVADRLKDSRPVVANLDGMDVEQQRRALDFISGAAYALDGAFERVGESVFLFVPGNVTIIDEG